MIRFSRARAAVRALILLPALVAAPAAAQSADGILAPGGHLRFEVAPDLHFWGERFGFQPGQPPPHEPIEPLGYDLENEPLLDITRLEARLSEAIGPTALALGSVRAQVWRERNEIALGAAVGVFDWLTLGVSVPLVQPRTEITFDFRARAAEGANLGLAPSLNEIVSFRADLQNSASELDERRAQECPDGPGCAALTDLADRFGDFAASLSAAYEEPLFVSAGSAAAVTLQSELASFRGEAEQLAPGVEMPVAAPVAATLLTEEELEGLLTAPPPGIALLNPLDTHMLPWELGDVEVTGALRILQGAVRDSASAPARFRWLVGATGLVRLPTGTADHPDIPLDQGGGDGQLDVEVGGFADLRLSRVGLLLRGLRGMQESTELERRVAPPEQPMAPIATRRLVRWTPGSYLELEAAPRWHLTDELALSAVARRFTKDADEYEEVGGVDPQLPPASVLARETEATLTEVGFGILYSTVESWRAGRARLPLEMRVAARKAIAGSGGATPSGWRLEGRGQVFVRLWGAPSAPALP
jgi:hypothetical protein